MRIPTLLATALAVIAPVAADSLEVITSDLHNGYPPSGLYYNGFWNTDNDGASYFVNMSPGCRNPGVPWVNEFCIDHDANRAHFWATGQNKRCFSRFWGIRYSCLMWEDRCSVTHARWQEVDCTW